MIDHRDLLLREVHHRVKNNLQMVDAMLAMQSRQVEDARTLGSIEKLRDRVHALAVVHAPLMAYPDLRTFDAAELLRELTAGLARKSVVWGEGVAARVVLGGWRVDKNKKT